MQEETERGPLVTYELEAQAKVAEEVRVACRSTAVVRDCGGGSLVLAGSVLPAPAGCCFRLPWLYPGSRRNEKKEKREGRKEDVNE